MKSNLLRRFVAGLLIAIPIVVLGIALYTVYEVIQFVGDPLFGLIGTGTPFESVIEHLLAAIAAFFVVYLLGYAAELQIIQERVSRLDRVLVLLVPGYTMINGFIGGVVHEDSLSEGFRPVLVDTVDSTRIGFEIERSASGKCGFSAQCSSGQHRDHGSLRCRACDPAGCSSAPGHGNAQLLRGGALRTG